MICSVCGNDIDSRLSHCPHCTTPTSPPDVAPGILAGATLLHRIVNLERGLPLVEQAMGKLRLELEAAQRDRVKVLTLIHGYGSTGQGGAIREEVQRTVQYLLYKNKLSSVIPGEKLHVRKGQGKDLVRRFPDLTKHIKNNTGNRGITVIVL